MSLQRPAIDHLHKQVVWQHRPLGNLMAKNILTYRKFAVMSLPVFWQIPCNSWRTASEPIGTFDRNEAPTFVIFFYEIRRFRGGDSFGGFDGPLMPCPFFSW